MPVRITLEHKPVMLVDAEDVELVTRAGPWRYALCDGKPYAQRVIRRPDGTWTAERLHTFLTGWPLVDHVNGNGLDNRRANLRAATPGQNQANMRRPRTNTSGFKGVSWFARTGKWRAYIGFENRQIHLGYFATPEEAARTYDAKAVELYGEFARPNFPEEIAS